MSKQQQRVTKGREDEHETKQRHHSNELEDLSNEAIKESYAYNFPWHYSAVHESVFPCLCVNAASPRYPSSCLSSAT